MTFGTLVLHQFCKPPPLVRPELHSCLTFWRTTTEDPNSSCVSRARSLIRHSSFGKPPRHRYDRWQRRAVRSAAGRSSWMNSGLHEETLLVTISETPDQTLVRDNNLRGSINGEQVSHTVSKMFLSAGLNLF